MARSRDEVSILQDTGYALRRLYRDQGEADAWALGTDIRLMARTAHVTKVGLDPSTDDTEIFGTGIDQINEMDKVLLPGGGSTRRIGGLLRLCGGRKNWVLYRRKQVLIR